MIDYQKLFIPSAPLLKSGGALEFDRISRTEKKDGTETVKAHYILHGKDGADLKVIQNQLTQNIIIENSIRKYYFGPCALCDLTKNEYVEATASISEALQLPLNYLYDARVYQMELGATLEVRNGLTASDYIENVVLPAIRARLKLSQRLENGIQAFNRFKQKVNKIYNKISELARTNAACTTDGGEYLRFEVKYNKQVARQTKIKTVNDIVRSYDYLIDVWINNGLYFDFEMNADIEIETQAIGFEDLCLIDSLRTRGLEGVLSKLRSDKDAGRISGSTLRRKKKQVNDMHEKLKDFSGVNLTGEFALMIKQTAENLRAA